MEISPVEISQRKKEIDELAELHQLEEWQKDRLFQEFVRRKSMGYEVSLLEIAKEWGWLNSDSENLAADLAIQASVETEPAPVGAGESVQEQVQEQLKAEVVDSIAPAQTESMPAASEVVPQAPTQEIAPQPVAEVAPAPVEVVQTPEAPAVEKQEIPQFTPEQVEQMKQQQMQQPEQAPAQQKQVQYPNYDDEIVGYKTGGGKYNDPDQIAQMVTNGPMDDASTWIAQRVEAIWKKLGFGIFG